jgi:PAS domain S-box-containing protein
MKMNDGTEEKKKMLKEVVKRLHEGESPQKVKEKFKKALEGTTAEDIAKVEQELVKEGMPREELQKLCDVHLAVFAEQVQEQELHIPSGHPINILMEEHKILLERAERFEVLVDMIKEACAVESVGDALTELQHIAGDFADSDKHYLREENVLFPLMEKHGISEPPAVMWMDHNKIREIEKKLLKTVTEWNSMEFQDFKTQLSDAAGPLCEILPDHFYKENNILFPTALQVVAEAEWKEARKDFDEIGYCCFTPIRLIVKPVAEETKAKAGVAEEGGLQFENGSLSKEEIEAILDSLPIDISFVDKNDRVKYFNKADKRIFVRTKSVIGRSVQLCHPQKSIHVVNRIVQSFTSGEKDAAEFWINMKDRLIHIRYFAVRDKNGKYMGTMEVTQDLTDIKKIEGEKRLLDWKD